MIRDDYDGLHEYEGALRVELVMVEMKREDGR